jgi:arginyl-tRNA synthetase
MFSFVEIKDIVAINLKEIISEVFKINFEEKEIFNLLEYPENEQNGDLAFPTFSLSKKLKESPPNIANKIIENLIENKYIKNHHLFSKIIFNSGYINFYLNKETILKPMINYLNEEFNLNITKYFKNYKLVLDYSSPNIAKPFGIGHLISTSLGESIKRIYKELGAYTFGINYLGDWGTQFGKVILSIIKWGDLDKIDDYSINDLFDFYVKFHKEEESNPSLSEEARELFSKLEKGDEKYLNIWKKLREKSIKTFLEIYNILNISFDSIEGESKYKDNDLEKVLKILQFNNLLSESSKAKVVFLNDIYNDNNMPPAIILKSNGTSTYLVRDIAALLDRWERFHFDKILYVVGITQELHFKQVFGIIKKLNFPFKDRLKHISFGTMRFQGQKMATREGNIVFLKDVYDKIYEKALYLTTEKGFSDSPTETSKKIAVGALNFSILKNSRTKDIDFNFEKVLSFEGDSSIYLQYTVARINSLINNFFIKFNFDMQNTNDQDKKELNNFYNLLFKKLKINLSNIINNISNLIYTNTLFEKLLIESLKFEDFILSAGLNYEPYLITRYILKLCGILNNLYNKEKIITDNFDESLSKILILLYIKTIIVKAFDLLNIPEIKKI